MRKLGLLLALMALGCSTYRDHLDRGQRLYQENQFDGALAIWRVLEPDMRSLSVEDQSRYAYLRGMTAYRLGFKRDARHWLAIAKAINQEHPGGLDGDWAKRTDVALDELNAEAFGLASASDSEAVEHEIDDDLGAAKNAPEKSSPGAAEPSSPKPGACSSEKDCSAQEVCIGGRCMAE